MSGHLNGKGAAGHGPGAGTFPEIIRDFPGKTNDTDESFEHLPAGVGIECLVNKNPAAYDGPIIAL